MPIGTVPLTKEWVEATPDSYLVDQVFPGQPLVISFGFVSWDKPPQFDFWGRLKKLDQLLGIQSNRILVRDLNNSWYHRPIPGLGSHVEEVATSLQELVSSIKPNYVACVGQSMGAYAAIMFGLLLEVDKVVAFGPLSFLNTQEAALYHDNRWLSVMEALEKNPPQSGYYDLRALCLQAQNKTQLDILMGTKPDGGSESVNLDAMHAQRLNVSPLTCLYPYPNSGHAVVQYLIDHHRQIDHVLAKSLFNVELKLALAEEWKQWVIENLSLGISPQEVISILVQNGFPEKQSEQHVQEACLPLNVPFKL